MKTFIRMAAVALAMAVAAPALAQQNTTTGDGAQIGIGAGISTASSGDGLSTGGIAFVPINIKSFRIEPFTGWTRVSVDDGRSSDFLIGVGGFLVKPVATQVQLYAGGRLGLEWHSTKDGAGNKTERRDLILAGALGGEYMPVPRVALGAELQLALASIGDTDRTDGPTGRTTTADGGWGTATQATFFARFYLF